MAKGKFDELMNWLDYMNGQFKEMEKAHEKSKINNLLNDNDIDLIK